MSNASDETQRPGDDTGLQEENARLGEILRTQERENAEQKSAVARSAHLKQVLLAIRNVHHLMIFENDPGRLIERACVNLTGTLGYHNAWIALLDRDCASVTMVASSGFDDDFEAIRRGIEQGEFPPCVRRAVEQDLLWVVADPPKDCPDCPLSAEYSGRAGLSRRLHYGGRTYGVLSVSVPAAFAGDEEEQALFDEMAGDLAFALHKIEAAKDLCQSRGMLARAERFAHFGSWEWDTAHDRVHWSDGLFRIFQLDPAGGAPSIQEYTHLFVPEDQQMARQALERCLTDGKPYELELRVRRTDGEIRHCVVRGQAETDAECRIRRIDGSLQDITERKRVEESVRGRERYLSTILQTTADGFFVLDTQGRVLEVNDAYCTMSAYKREELIGMGIRDLDVYESPAETAARIERIRTNGSEIFEARHVRKDGSVWPVEVSATWMDEDGGRFVCFGRDLTMRKEREERIALLGRMLDEAPAAITILDGDGRFLFANRQTVRLHGYRDEADFLAVNLRDLDVPEGEALQTARSRRVAVEGEARFEVSHYRKDGSTFPLEVLVKTIEWDGRPAFLSIATDITERRTAEEALRVALEQLEAVFESSMVGIMVLRNRVITKVNPRMAEMLGHTPEEITGRSPEHLHLSHAHFVEFGENYYSRLAERAVVQVEFPLRHKDGRTVWCLFSGKAIAPETGLDAVWVIDDITERKQVEERLRLQSLTLDQIEDRVTVTDLQGFITYVNEAECRMLGRSSEELIGQHVSVYGEDSATGATQEEIIRRTLVDGAWRGEVTNFRKDGTAHVLECRTHVVKDDTGRPIALCGISTDITDRKRAEEEKARLEEQFHQAQRLESVGRLAGGVAHDFNNLLMGIMNYADLCREKIEHDHPIQEWLDEIIAGARRSAELTHQLLAFARRQIVSPRLLDLNDAVSGILKMLRRLIGEDIQLAWLPGANLRPVWIDPSQIDQILANLAVNARDAIGGVGKLTVQTANMTIDEDYCAVHADAAPGKYVMLAVTDDGKGMDRETMSHIFEPFFTTKGVGEGTGLGLATVHGIVRQNGGFVEVASEPGVGSTFRIYLPQHRGDPSETGKEEDVAEPPRGRETVLVAEDEQCILVTLESFLQALGYRVLAAPDPESALRLAAGYGGPIHLLITDVVMPGMSGRELATRLVKRRPDLKCLYISGYTADVIAHRGVLDGDVDFLSKPFTRDQLASKVRVILDRT